MKFKSVYIVSIAFSFLLASCATLFNKKIQTIAIVPHKDIRINYVKQDTTILHEGYGHYITLRSAAPLEVNFVNLIDSQTHTASKHPYRSNAYWWNINAYAIGMVVDEFSNKKFAYPPKMYVTNDNKLVIEKKGKIRINVPIEYILYWKDTDADKFFFMSVPASNIGLGLEYYYKHNTFISGGLNIGYFQGVSDNANNFLDGYGLTLNFRHGHVVNNFEFTYGLGLIQSSRISSLGFNANITNMLTRVTGLQLGYEPHFYDIKNSRMSYTSLLRMGLIFKINANP